MKRIAMWSALIGATCLLCAGHADGRGFGGFRGGGFGGGGFDRSFGGFDRSYGGFGGDRSFSSFSADRSFGNYSGSRSFDSFSGSRNFGATSSYDRSFDGNRGGSISTSGTRGVDIYPGGAAVGGSRDISATGPEGRTYSGSREAGAAVGPYGRVGGGESRTGSFAGTRFPTDLGLSHYSAFGAAGVGVGHMTSYWSGNAMATRAYGVRTNFGYYNAFRPAWYTAHPGAWAAAGWTAARAWETPAWDYLVGYVGVPFGQSDYDYGSEIVYQDNNVYVDGQDVCTAPVYAEQATALAEGGQQATPPATTEWQPLGVFALVQGTETTSNNIFQLAVSKDGVLRGNYYDGLMNTTTPIYGSVQKSTQRCAWTIGKTKDRVFEAGLFNLTKAETPVLVHFGADRTQQWLLVRMKQPQTAQP